MRGANDRRELLVAKVGGSLYDLPDLGARLREWLRQAGQDVILVPGGGPIVEAIRALDQVHQLGDEACHWLALRALSANARLLAQLLPGAEVITAPEKNTQHGCAILDLHEFALA